MRWIPWIRRGALAAAVLLLLAAGGGYLWLRTSLPQTEGTLDLPGLAAPVELRRDAHGLVRIRAENEADAYFALGFAHAQDRLFQMDIMRRLGAGRLSEVFGARAIEADRTMRTLGLYRAAEANLPRLAPEVRAALDAYSAGVNAFLQTRRGSLPPEFVLLFYRPEPWRPADSLVWGRLMAFHLSGNWREELLRARLSQRLKPDQLDFLWPAMPDDDGRIEASVVDPSVLDRMAAALAVLPRSYGASNNWAVSGALTATGKPLLANDPHLAFGAPIQWYLARIETPTLSVTGATAPGVPFTLIGHNGRVAWGFTTTHSDTQDLFVERLVPDDPSRYLTPTGSEPFATREETIRVRGGEDIALTVRATRHGPVVSDIGMAPDGMAGRDQVVALAWPGLRTDDLTAEAIYRMNRAGDAAAFRAALRDFHSPQQNILYADREGSIGFVAAGRVPVRKSLMAGSQMPAPGWTGGYDWTGYLPFEALPQAVDPPSGWLATANNNVTPADYRHFIAARWEEPYRIQRIVELLDGATGLTGDRMAAMQLDILSPAARDLLPPMLAAARAGGSAPRAMLDLLERWDYRAARDRPEPLIFLTWQREAARRIFADEMGPLFFEYWSWNLDQVASVLSADDPAAAAWCDDVETIGSIETCAEQFAAALDDARSILAAAYGENPAEWRWGAAHRAFFRHPLFDRIPVLGNWLAVPRVETDGDNYTLNRGTPQIPPEGVLFPHVHGSGLRAVFDLADLDRSRFIIAGGQSGNPFSPHYADLVRPWRDGELVTLAGEADRVLTLRPAAP